MPYGQCCTDQVLFPEELTSMQQQLVFAACGRREACLQGSLTMVVDPPKGLAPFPLLPVDPLRGIIQDSCQALGLCRLVQEQRG